MANINKSNTAMTELNWRDASKELPELDALAIPRKCLIVVSRKNCKPFIREDWFLYASNEWQSSINKQVTHWIYADEIPLPKE